ncbi:MAG: carboxylate-amine ligase [Leptolyngbyaceae bacterium]|nr:carboxylate-amine ligase [Leptolyngbyaceae bacterium]
MSDVNAFTIGVEEEYQIINPRTRELASRSGKLIDTNQHDAQHPQELLYEMHRCQIEIATGICKNLDDVRRELTDARQTAMRAAQQHGLAIAAAGTHPFSRWQNQKITPKDRYRNLDNELQQLIREMVAFGCHVHIGIADREAAVAVLNRSRIWLPTLLSLTANSPFWLGRDTGYQSYRMELLCRLPTAGPPPHFKNYDDYRTVIQQLIDTDITNDPTKIYWDIRLSERFPTVEFRVADVCTTVDEAVVFAGIIRALAQTCYEDFRQQKPYPMIRSEILKAAMWQAARYGLQGEVIDFNAMRAIAATESIKALLHYLTPALKEQGSWDMVRQHVELMLVEGNSAQRQQQIYHASGSHQAVVDDLIERTTKNVL